MNLNVIHWLFIFVGSLAIILSIIIVLLRKKNFLQNHKILSLIGVLLIDLNLISIYLNKSKINLSYLHGIIGFLFIILSIFTVVLGIIFTSKIDVKIKKRVRINHIWLGRLLFLLLILNIIIGYILFKPFK